MFECLARLRWDYTATVQNSSYTRQQGGTYFLFGPVLGAGVDFLIVASLVFWFSKKVLKEETVTKK